MAVGFSSFTATQNQPQPENAFDCLVPYFPASKSRKPSWDIFINHYGRDVKHTLASTIYRKLHSMGFNVFLDKDALDAGDAFPAEIQHAIASASLHIAIFSPNYPQSPWCLTELCSMHKTGKKIIPIFYHVDPSDLRWMEEGKGWYAHVFSEHKKKGRYESEKLDEWKKALCKCSILHGYPINNERDEAAVLKNIVNDALKITNRKDLSWVAEHPVGDRVGLDELVQEFESVAREKALQIWGIAGMGGSGKTTLAKELFNKNLFSFERCSFVSDVRDAASGNALHDKQKKLLKDLGVDDLPFDNVDEGRIILANHLSSHRALIVLDDVDHIDQLSALLPNKYKLESQSMVIVTSRDSNVLTSFGISCVFKMKGLNLSHAEQLLCWHAFLQSSPPAEFQYLVEAIVMACNGLPLSLKVLGAQLYGRKSEYWKFQLEKISGILPSEIKGRLKVSYDALDEEEREMFLDVACFLVGEEKSTAIAVWNRFGWSGRHGLERLMNRCLVECMEGKTRIWMHPHLREMGRQIATTYSPYRLRCAEKINKMKEHSMAEQIMEAIEEAHVEELGESVATAESSGAGPSSTDGQSVDDFVGEIKARDSIIAELGRDRDRLNAELNALQSRLAGMQQDCAKRKTENLRLELDRDKKESLVQELQAQVEKLSAESQRLCLDRDMAMRLLEGEGMGHAFTQLMDVATRMDQAHKESSYYRGLYERLVPIAQREPPFAGGSFAGYR